MKKFYYKIVKIIKFTFMKPVFEITKNLKCYPTKMHNFNINITNKINLVEV